MTDDFTPQPFPLPELPPDFRPAPNCPACDAVAVSYQGIQDGGGDYGTSICDCWRCEMCGNEWESDCIDMEDTYS